MKNIYPLFIINGLLVILIIGIVSYGRSYIEMDNARHQALVVATDKKTAEIITPATPEKNLTIEPSAEENKIIEMLIENNYATPQNFPAYAAKPITIKITNNEKKSISFVMEKINYDSGAINPGETKEIKIDNIPQEQGSYEYKISTNDKLNPIIGNIIVF